VNKLNICGFSLCCAGFSLLASAMPDPTAPDAVLTTASAQTAAATPLPKLSLIRLEGKERLAILDGQARRVGARHGVYQVVAITPGRVVLAQGQRQLTLQLFPSMNK
jgi:hypothetical protein